MTVPFNPWFDRVLLKRERRQKVGSIIVPEDAQRRNSRARGEIVAVGDQCMDRTREAIGKTVLFGVHAGAWLDANGVEKPADDADFFICAETDILGDVE